MCISTIISMGNAHRRAVSRCNAIVARETASSHAGAVVNAQLSRMHYLGADRHLGSDMRCAMRRIWPGVLVAGALLLAGPAATQEIEADVGGGEALAIHVSPGQETRTPGAVTADTFELYAPSPQREIGRVSIPDDKLAALQQPQGRDWRTFRIHWVFWLAAAAIIVMVAVLAAFFFWRGRIRIESGRFGRWVPRFRAVERFAHWITALSFIVYCARAFRPGGHLRPHAADPDHRPRELQFALRGRQEPAQLVRRAVHDRDSPDTFPVGA